jgi:hypothetical protein
MYFIVSVHEEAILTFLYNIILQHTVACHLLRSSLMCQHGDTQAAQEQWLITNEYTSVYMGLKE